MIVKLTGNNGSLDTAFDDDGKAVYDFGSSNDTGKNILLDGTGRVVISGETDKEGSSDFFILRVQQ